MKDPRGHHIAYDARACACKGKLDRDDRRRGGPENIFWPKGRGPHGSYTYYAVYYRGSGTKTATLEVRRGEEVVRTHKLVLRCVRDRGEPLKFHH